MGELTVSKLEQAELWEIREGLQRLLLTRAEAEELHRLLPCENDTACPCFQAGYEAKREPL